MYIPVGVQQYNLSLPWDFPYMYIPVGIQQYNLSLPWDFPYMYIPVGVQQYNLSLFDGTFHTCISQWEYSSEAYLPWAFHTCISQWEYSNTTSPFHGAFHTCTVYPSGSKAVQPLSSMGLSIHVMMYVPVGVQQYILSLPWDFTYMYFPVGVQQYYLSLPWYFPYMYIPVGV
jgi:hypothetical protein